ncbi:MAG: response regulator transcription factor [Burkholderiaceae bacterium]
MSPPKSLSSAQVLLVDPDPLSRSLIREWLEHWGHQVSAGSDPALLDRAPVARVDLLLLDPSGAGGQAWQRLRNLRRRSRLPIIAMLPGDDAFDRVLAFESGADVVIAKPVDARELRLRMQGLIGQAQQAGNSLRFGRWTLEAVTRRLCGPGGFSAPLSLAEYRLLRAFLERPQSVLRRAELLELARGEGQSGAGGDALDRSVDLLISRLRHKLDDDARAPRLIRTVRGIGYLFDDTPPQPGGGRTDQDG